MMARAQCSTKISHSQHICMPGGLVQEPSEGITVFGRKKQANIHILRTDGVKHNSDFFLYGRIL